MSQDTIDVDIGQRKYRLNVEAGQEARLKAVASQYNNFVEKMHEQMGALDRDRVLVMAGIMLADEFLTLRQEQDTNRRSVESFHNHLAERLEKLAKKNSD